MKILHLVSSLGVGGAEKLVVDLSREMALTNSVMVLVLDNASDIGKDEKYASNLLYELEKSGVTVSFVGSKARSKPLKIFRRLVDTIKKFDPDIVHSHLLIWSVFLSFIPFTGKKHFFTQHTNRLKLPWLHKLWLKHRIIGYVSICKEVSLVLDLEVKASNVKRINNGIDLSGFPSKRQSKVSTTCLNFVTVSRLNSLKNHKLILDAIPIIRLKTNKSFKINIVGDGPMLPELMEIAQRNGIDNYIDFLGQRSDINDILHQNDVFLLPSKVEGFSIALIEALSSGIDIIASDVGENNYILGSSKFGSLFDSGNVEALACLMLLRIEQGTMARDNLLLEKHLCDFSISKSSKHHLDFYRESI